MALPTLRILAIYFSSFHVWHTGDKERIHSRPAKEVDFSNAAINLRQKIFWCGYGFVKKRSSLVAFFFFAWFTLTEKYRKPNYRAAAKGFNNAHDLCRVKQHGGTRGNVIQGVKVNQAGKAINLRC